MRALILIVAGMFAANIALAGEARLGAGLEFGTAELEDDAGDELSADLESLRFSGTYFLGESGPFFGIAVGQEKADNIEFNGQDLGLGSVEADSRALTLGYRAGKTGEPQYLFSVSRLRFDVDGGSNSDSTIVSFGVERDFGNGRFSVVGNYENGDDDSSLGANVGAVFYVTEELGFFGLARYSVGETDFGGEDVDSREFHIGGGIELRFHSN